MTSEPRAYRRDRRIHGWQRGAFAGRYASSAPPPALAVVRTADRW